MTAMEIMLSKLSLSTADPATTLALLETEQKVRNYCNIPEEEPLLTSLNFTLANMAIDLLKNDPISEDIEDMTVKSVTMGETSYTFDTSSKRQVLDKLLLDYESDLVKFRRIRK